jgi:RHS repeat-associated protein
VQLSFTDLASSGFGTPWGQTRSWTNNPGYTALGGNGSGWVDEQLPYLLQTDTAGNTLVLVTNGTTAHYFNRAGTGYQARFYDQDQLAINPASGEAIVTDPAGDQLHFTGYGYGVPAVLSSFVDPYGNSTRVVARTATGRVAEVQRSSGGVTESYLYQYLPPGVPNAGLLQNVTLRRSNDGGATWTVVREVAYAYYAGGQPYGNLGDLLSATIEDAAGRPLDTDYYRYDTANDATGYVHGLKYVFGPQAYARLVAAVGNPTTATDAQVAPYADDYFQYDSQHRVTREVAAGAGNAGGQGSFTFAYQSSLFPPGYNTWSTHTTETLPDGSTNDVYCNAFGEVMLSAFRPAGDPRAWATWSLYDGQGRLIQTANPSAVSGYDDSRPDLLNNQGGHYQYLQDNAGLIQILDYYSSTTATETTPGGAFGYLQDTKLKRGQLGTPVLQGSMQYFAHSGGGSTIYPVAATSVYRNSDGTGAETTRCAYVFYPNTTGVQTRTVTRPVIAATQNGPGMPDVESEAFDPLGRVTQVQDGDGFVTTWTYDPATSAVTRIVEDVGNPMQHLNLSTSMEVDSLGRPTRITDANGNVTYIVYNDPNHEVRTYPGWNSAANRPTGPTIVTREDRGHNPSYVETLTMSAAPNVDAARRPTGTEPISGVQTLTRSYVNAGGQVFRHDDYFSLSGMSYGTGLYPGTVNVNYYTTLTDFDNRGRPYRVTSPTGTLTQTNYDALGRVSSTAIGTNPGNLTTVLTNQYDQGGVGDGNLTRQVQLPGGSAAARETDCFYDWRDRLVASKDGVQSTEDTSTHRPITYVVYDNLSEAVEQDRYDGDTVSVTTGSDGVPVKPSASLLRAQTTSEYDDQGRVFRRHVFSVDQTNGTVSPTSLTTSTFYDHRGHVVKTAAPGGLVTKTQYDGVGRATKVSLTDGQGDASWSDAMQVTASNHVLSQILTQYDGDGNPILVTSKDRFHDETAGGDLGSPSSVPHARVSFVASYYDAANRLIATVNAGTNGGTPWSRPATVPLRSDTLLVTTDVYNAAGWVQDVTDPRGLIMHTLYDNLGRTTATTENYSPGNPNPNASNRTTEYTYDGDNHVLTQKADLPGGAFQTTQYVYGVSTGTGSDLNSNDLLAAVNHPDPVTGQPSTAYQDRYTYNTLGERKAGSDRNGTTHVYSYDVLGRLTADAIIVLGSGVDGQVMRLETAYDTGGRPYLFTSFDSSSGGNVLNQVERLINGLGQLVTEYQSHYGPVVPGSTPSVQYTWSEMAGGANHSRLVSMTYPTGRILHYVYNSGLDDAISRLSFLADDDGAGGIGTHLEEYSYLGLSTAVQWVVPEPKLIMTWVRQPGDPSANPDGGDQYTGLDRFGRVIDQFWIARLSGAAIDRFQYGYDRDGNRLYEANLVAEALGQPFDELFHLSGVGNGYDGLNRITDFALGQLNATRDGLVGTPGSTENWALDLLGNWGTFSSGGTTQTRHHNAQNQITDINGNPLGYDNNGNTTTDDRGYTIVYDAWNRPVQVFDSFGNLLAAYSYDALGRRIQEFENDFWGNPTTRDLFFSARWQVVEEWETDPFANTVLRAQEVWSPVYVDALVLRDRDPVPGGSGILSERLYALQDANWNVRAVVDTTGTVQERYVYDPYGQVTVWDPLYGQALGGSQFGFAWLYQGGRLDSDTGLYHFRHRDYSPTLGRWLQQDPAGYVDSMNLYALEKSNPVTATDPQGWCLYQWPPNPVAIWLQPDSDSGSGGSGDGSSTGGGGAGKHSMACPPPPQSPTALAFVARDLMIPLLIQNVDQYCILTPELNHISRFCCIPEISGCPGCSNCSGITDWHPPYLGVDPAALGDLRTQLQQALSANGPAGNGVAFTTRDLMIPLVPFGCGVSCVLTPGPACWWGTHYPTCLANTIHPLGCPLNSGEIVEVACPGGSAIVNLTIPQCTCSRGPDAVSLIDPAELVVLQRVLQVGQQGPQVTGNRGGVAR